MWKDFLNFNKRERITIVSLTLLIVLVQVLIWTKSTWVRFLPTDLEQKYQRRQALVAYRDSVAATKSYKTYTTPSTKKRIMAEPVVRVPFNPNTADSTTLKRLGLRAYVVKNILQYRRKGGTFRKPADLTRIYGLDPALFAELEPLIRLERAEPTVGEGQSKAVRLQEGLETKPVVAAASEPNPQSEERIRQRLDINAADTSTLQQLKGVGSFTASRITKYRNQLGGFYSLAQLAEVKGLYPETLTRLQAMLDLDPTQIRRLDANNASLEKLRAHPYLSFYQAKVIVELRRARGKISSLEDLKDFKEFSVEDLERLKWYLKF